MGAQQNQSKSEEEMFNWSDVHLYWSNFLQNLYFSCTVFNYRRKRVTRNNSYLCNSLSNRGLPYNSKVKNSLFCPRKKMRSKSQTFFDLNDLKNDSAKFEIGLKSMHFSKWLIWSINLCWASKLIQIYLPDKCGLMHPLTIGIVWWF